METKEIEGSRPVEEIVQTVGVYFYTIVLRNKLLNA